MHKTLICLFLFSILSCNNKKNEKPWGYDSYFPEHFIDPKTNVTENIDYETDEIIQSLTTYKFHDEKGWQCSDEWGKQCDGNIKIPMKIFINYGSDKKEISFLKVYEGKCDCYPVFHIMSELSTIEVKDISRIDTLGNYNYDKDGRKLTAINIFPKYDKQSIKYKSIYREYDSIENQTLYKKIENNTSYIMFQTDWRSARYLKEKIEKLKELN